MNCGHYGSADGDRRRALFVEGAAVTAVMRVPGPGSSTGSTRGLAVRRPPAHPTGVRWRQSRNSGRQVSGVDLDGGRRARRGDCQDTGRDAIASHRFIVNV